MVQINTRSCALSVKGIMRAAAFGLISCLIFSFSGCYFFPKEEEVLAPPLKVPEQVTYQTMDVKTDTIQRKIEGNALLMSVEQSDLFFRDRGGRLKKIYVKIGDKVKKGDVLAELDNEEIINQIKQQEIALRKAEISYEQQKLMGKLDIASAERKLDRLREEYEKKSAAGVSIAELESLKEQIMDQETNLYKLKMLYGSGSEDEGYALKQAAFSIQEARMRLEQLNKELERSRLLAPFDGDIIYIDERIREGSYVNAYQILIRIADPTKLQLVYSASDASQLALGMKVDVTFRSTPQIDKNKVFEGKVVMTPSEVPADASDELRRSSRIEVQNMPKEAKIGDYAYITVVLEEKRDTIVIPKNLLNRLAGRTYVYVLVDEVREERDVRVGIQTPTQVEILDGLQVGDKLLLN